MSILGAKKKKPMTVGTKRSNRYRRPQGSGLMPETSNWLRRLLAGVFGLACLLALMAGLYYAYQFVTTSTFFALEEITVEGNAHLSYGQVIEDGHVRLGQNCLALNVSRVEARLAKNPWVKSVAVRRELPGRLVVTIVEKVPAYLTRSGSSLYYADETGVLIAAVTPGDFQSLPVLDAAPSAIGHLDTLPDVRQALHGLGLPYGDEYLASLSLTDAGEIIVFLDAPGLTIRFEAGGYDRELPQLMQVIADLKRRGELAHVTMITAQGNRVWVRKRG